MQAMESNWDDLEAVLASTFTSFQGPPYTDLDDPHLQNFRPGKLPDEESTYGKYCRYGYMDRQKNNSRIISNFFRTNRPKANAELDPKGYPGLYEAYLITVQAWGTQDTQAARHQDLQFLMSVFDMTFPPRLSISAGVVLNDQWEVVKLLDAGSEVDRRCFNDGIWLVKDKAGESSILKVLFSNELEPGLAEREIRILGSLNHPNIIKLRDASLDDGGS
jgi:hypothetical protein